MREFGATETLRRISIRRVERMIYEVEARVRDGVNAYMHSFGIYSSRKMAEQCACNLSQRVDIIYIGIKEEDDNEG